MSPYGGQATHPVWDEVDTRQFLQESQDRSPCRPRSASPTNFPTSAGWRSAPAAPRHLAELVAATALDADDNPAGTGVMADGDC